MDSLLGEIRIFSGNYVPKGWEKCDGTKLWIQGNEALFAVLGTQYGGDGQTSFQLPDIASVPCKQGYPIYIINVTGTSPPPRG